MFYEIPYHTCTIPPSRTCFALCQGYCGEKQSLTHRKQWRMSSIIGARVENSMGEPYAAVTSADAPVNYGDFLLFTALELAISSFTAAVDESELPDGLGKWWNKMLKTKAVAALKGKGKKLMPGEHNKAW